MPLPELRGHYHAAKCTFLAVRAVGEDVVNGWLFVATKEADGICFQPPAS